MANSASLQAIKVVKEKISESWTSAQLIEVLDLLIFRALNQVIETTTLADRIIASILIWYSKNSKRKLSAIHKDKLLLLLFSYITETRVEVKKRILKRCRLERNIYFLIIQTFLAQTKDYRELLEKLTKKTEKGNVIGISKALEKLRTLERKIGCIDAEQLYSAIRHCEYWYSQATVFKNQMMEKYMRLVAVQSRLYYNNNPLVTDLDDVIQNLILAVSKAIDKFDPNKGALTSYVQNWIMNAKLGGSFNHEYGNAYSIPHSKKLKIAKNLDMTNNLSVSLESEEAKNTEDTTMQEKLLKVSTEERVRRLAKAANPLGISRIILGIGEYLSPAEVNCLKQCKVNDTAKESKDGINDNS